MNFVDIAISLLFVYVFYSGFNKGIIKQLTNIVNIIFSILLSYLLNSHFSVEVKKYLDFPDFLLPIVAFIFSFIIIITILKIISYFLQKFVEMLRLGFINQLLGGVFAFIKYLLLLLIPFLFFKSINQKFNLLDSENIFWYSFYENLYNFFIKH